MKGEFVGDAGRLAGIALSTNGRQVIAYLCDGNAQYLTVPGLGVFQLTPCREAQC